MKHPRQSLGNLIGGRQKDTRLQCPYCKMRTWSKNYTQFMADHDRRDGRRCLRASSGGLHSWTPSQAKDLTP